MERSDLFPKTSLDELLLDAKFSLDYAQERLVNEMLERICALMADDGVSRSRLAEMMGTSKANVSQVLGGRDVKVRTLARFAHVLGHEFHVELRKISAGKKSASAANVCSQSVDRWGDVVDMNAYRSRMAIPSRMTCDWKTKGLSADASVADGPNSRVG